MLTEETNAAIDGLLGADDVEIIVGEGSRMAHLISSTTSSDVM